MMLRLIVTTKCIVAIAIAVLAVSPRLPDNRPLFNFGYPCISLGGRLTHRFRLLVVIMLVLHVARSLVADLYVPYLGTQLVLGVLETFSASFGVLYTPYLLQVWLLGRINIGGRPGDNLKTWWIAITSISIVAGVLADTVSLHFWALKKVANVISVYPVWTTLQKYNSVTMLGGPYPGRGTVLSQLVSHCEIFVLLSNLADIGQEMVMFAVASGYYPDVYATSVTDGGTKQSHNDSVLMMLMLAIRHTSGFAAWIRILCHSILLNVLDEQCFISEHTTTDDDAEGAEGNHLVTTLVAPLGNRLNSKARP